MVQRTVQGTPIGHRHLARCLQDQSMRWLIATDLDGTLLDDTYPLEAAARAIDTVTRQAEVVLASSKTFSELLDLASLCATPPLLVFENGAGVAWPHSRLELHGTSRQSGYEIECIGAPYTALRTTLIALRDAHRFDFVGFGDLPVDAVAASTGLDRDAASLARARMRTEPLIWRDGPEALDAFAALLAEQDLLLTRGGRFHHVMPQTSKADGVAHLRQLLAPAIATSGTAASSGAVVSRLVACGDAPNDAELLDAADHAIVFPGRDGRYLQPRGGRVSHAAAAGPSGWLDAVSSVITTTCQEACLG